MNMTALYISFCAIFGVYAIFAAALILLHLAVMKARGDFERIRGEKKPFLSFAEDFTIRVRNGQLLFEEAEPPEAPEVPAEPSEGAEGVFLTKGEKLSFAEKYSRLDEGERELLREFSAFIDEQPFCGTKAQTDALLFRYKKSRIAKAAIRRDVVCLEFAILNPELGRMVREEKPSGVRIKPVEIRLYGRGELELAKQTALMTVEYLQNEENYKRDKRNEARREAARLRREERASAEKETEEPERRELP